MALDIKSSLTQPWRNCMNHKSMLAAIKSEMAVYECSGVRGRILQLYLLLFAVNPPTSVEAERSFSAQGYFVPSFVRISVTRRWILCAFCAAIVATRGLDLHSLCTLYM